MIYTIIKRDDNDTIEAIISFDSVTSFDESWSATVTSQTVEYGFDVSDNINIEAPSYEVSAIISSYSLFNTDSEIVWDGSDFVSIGGTGKDSHIEARDELIEIFKSRTLLTLLESSADSVNSDLVKKYEELTSSHNREIDDCVMTSLKISHPDSGTGAFIVSMNLQKVNRAYVRIDTLTEDEMRSGLRPLTKTFESENSKQSTDKGDTDPVSGLPVEEGTIDPATGNREEVRKLKEEVSGYNKLDTLVKARVESTALMSSTGETYTARNVGSNGVVTKGADEYYMLKDGGLVKIYKPDE